jgi:uncharacterized protein with PIN domain
LKFIADGMLGKLTRWLRILGHDVKYSSNVDDAALVDAAKKERRILLTRDFELYKQATAKGIDTFYVEGETGVEKLAEIAGRFGIDLNVNMATSRCPKCNSKIKPVSKDKVADKVGKSTFAHYDEFWKCQNCGQIYWQGAHWKGIRGKLDRTKEALKTIEKNNRELPDFQRFNKNKTEKEECGSHAH